MNPHKDDPNNHAPAVSPDDDWYDLDVDQIHDSQLPPRRSELPGIPKVVVTSSVYQKTHSDRHPGEASPVREGSNFTSSVAFDVHVDRQAIEKRDFQAARVMKDPKQADDSAKRRQRVLQRHRLSHEERDDWGAGPKKSAIRWIFYSATGVIALIGFAIFSNLFLDEKSEKKSNENRLGQIEAPKVKKEPIRILGAMGKLVNSNREANRIFGLYAQARSESEFLQSIYLGGRNAPSVMDRWRPIGAEKGWMPSDDATWKTFQVGEVPYAELRGLDHNFSKFVAFFRYENSDLKMDWKATTGYGTAGFDQLKIGKGDGSEIRGRVSRSDFFTQQLSDDKYHSFIVRSPQNDASIWAYTEIGNQVDQDILALFSVSPITGEYQTEVSMILNLERGNQEILPHQWMIKSLIAANWLDQATP
jgi:hypothetical protein